MLELKFSIVMQNHIQGYTQDISELSLNCIENPPITLDFYIKFECKTSTRPLSVGIKIYMRDLI